MSLSALLQACKSFACGINFCIACLNMGLSNLFSMPLEFFWWGNSLAWTYWASIRLPCSDLVSSNQARKKIWGCWHGLKKRVLSNLEWSQAWQDCWATGAEHHTSKAGSAVNCVNLISQFWFVFWSCKRMLGEVFYRKATLEDWKDIERVSQVLNERSIGLPWLGSSGCVRGTGLPTKCLQCVDYWRGNREDSQVVQLEAELTNLTQVQLCGRIGWKHCWLLLSAVH